MGKINYARVIVGAVIVGVFYFITDGAIHGGLLEADYIAAITGAGKPLQHDSTTYIYFAAFDLGKALVAILFYAAARPRLGAGIKTAAWSGLFAWLAVEALPAIAAMPFPFFEKSHYWKVLLFEIPSMVLGGILGGWIYREPVAE